jgi:hypothetical protein
MTTSIFSQITRSVTSLGPLTKLAKFTSTSAKIISKLFDDSDRAKAIGSVSKPLSEFIDFTDLTSFIDPINGLFSSSLQRQWSTDKLKLITKIALIAGLLLTPISFLSKTLELFPLGVLSENIAAHEELLGIHALQSCLTLPAVLYNIYERYTQAGADARLNETNALKKTSNLVLMYESLLNEDGDDFRYHAKKSGKTRRQIQQIWAKFQADRSVSLAAPIKHARLLHHVEVYNAQKNAWSAIDDINKCALTTITFISAFVSGAVAILVVAGALKLYSAYVGWQKSDAEALASKEKVAVFESLRDNHDQLKDWLVV